MEIPKDIQRVCPKCLGPAEITVFEQRILCETHGRLDYWLVYAPSINRRYFRASLEDAPSCLHPDIGPKAKWCPDCHQTLGPSRKTGKPVRPRSLVHALYPPFTCQQCGRLVEDRLAKNCKGQPKYCSVGCSVKSLQGKPNPRKMDKSTAA